ncbi:hypothetical protein [Sphingobacterium sp. T2]|nr:hypothetical protein [Sphingobacterium sp. T2]
MSKIEQRVVENLLERNIAFHGQMCFVVHAMGWIVLWSNLMEERLWP